MKRFLVSLTVGLIMATLAIPAYAEDSSSSSGTSTEITSSATVSGSATAEVDLSKYFTAEQLAGFSEKELAALKKKIQHRAEKDKKFEEKLKKEYDRLIAKKKKQQEALARRAAKTKVLQGFVSSIDTVKGYLYLKKGGAQAGVQVTAKTMVNVVEADGARIGTLADFQAGDRVFGLVRRNPNDPQQLIGVVLIKIPAQERGGDDDDDSDNTGTSTPTN